MASIITSLFDTLGRAFTSIGAVIFVMVMIITAMIFFSHTLFLQVFPETMAPWEKSVATWAMALGWELTVLITTCNTAHISKRIPGLMAIASGVIVLFFIQAFDDSLTVLQYVQRGLVGVLAASINYIYADLFYSKWQERTNALQMPARLKELEAQVEQLEADLQESDAELEQSQAKVKEFTAELKEQEREIKQLESFKAKIEQSLKCPYCSQAQTSQDALRSHKGHCSLNPKNK